VQVLGPVAVGLYSFAVAWILGKIIDKTMGFRIPEEDELEGIDIAEHAESAYEFGGIHQVLVGSVHAGSAPATREDMEDGELPVKNAAPVAGTH